MFIVTIVVLVFVLGDVRLSRSTSTARTRTQPEAARNVEGDSPLFDNQSVHGIDLDVSRTELRRVFDELSSSGDTIFVQADVTIDGTTVENVGIRLKGTGALAGLGSDPSGLSDLFSQEPLLAPWLIRFDEFVDGQRYQGHRELAIRPLGSATTPTTGLAEALTLVLADSIGLPSPAATFAGFSVNGSTPLLRLVVENPGDSLVEADFDAPVALYRARSTGRFVDLGDRPLSYAEAFEQITLRNQQDIAPLIQLIQWVSTADDATFDSQIDAWIDADAFARQLAFDHIVMNPDGIGGPSQNYYLALNTDRQRFGLVGWDMNNTWSGDATAKPFDPIDPESTAVAEHLLVDRFLESPRTRQIYLDTYSQLVGVVFGEADPAGQLDRLRALLGESATRFVEPVVVEADASRLARVIADRAAALAAVAAPAG